MCWPLLVTHLKASGHDVIKAAYRCILSMGISTKGETDLKTSKLDKHVLILASYWCFINIFNRNTFFVLTGNFRSLSPIEQSAAAWLHYPPASFFSSWCVLVGILLLDKGSPAPHSHGWHHTDQPLPSAAGTLPESLAPIHKARLSTWSQYPIHRL